MNRLPFPFPILSSPFFSLSACRQDRRVFRAGGGGVLAGHARRLGHRRLRRRPAAARLRYGEGWVQVRICCLPFSKCAKVKLEFEHFLSHSHCTDVLQYFPTAAFGAPSRPGGTRDK